MTKSTITRERLQEIAEDGFLKHGESKELARMALAAMNSEPVTLQPELAKVIYHFRDWNEGFPVERFKADYIISWMLANYPPAQPAPVVSAELLHTAASAIEDLLTTKDRTGACVWFDLPFRLRSAANAQPAPVVPDDVSIFEAAIEECKKCDSIDEHAWNHGVLAVIAKYESCRAAMLQELKKSAGTEAICRSDENVQVLHTKSPAQSDCCPAQNSVTPAQNQGWIPVSERMPENDGAYLCWDNRYVTTYAFIFGAWQANQFIAKNITHWMPLPAAPQEVNRE
ncbi:TPA: DUF551 domain-containing protein [Raoultella ornithinolytica]|uniref:DUF551 domain-containing protein n=1 Tax=Klebsiella/Raoultella group TaxID=2890311 RepID=UPI001A257FF0|nr:DUF551 domain-containing protein [Klebsiella pneumoniae]ELH1432643.1 DUF551 domain-containing protein [Raoultella ornithinolytica]HAT3824417.1 DUF551 domain-containing protein [Raoultella ornithinolytica]HDG7808592.1 DUF551 domain-containing protein [Klebsiella quasipneumoniae]